MISHILLLGFLLSRVIADPVQIKKNSQGERQLQTGLNDVGEDEKRPSISSRSAMLRLHHGPSKTFRFSKKTTNSSAGFESSDDSLVTSSQLGYWEAGPITGGIILPQLGEMEARFPKIDHLGVEKIGVPPLTEAMEELEDRRFRSHQYSRLLEILKSRGMSMPQLERLKERMKAGELTSSRIQGLIDGLELGTIGWSDIRHLADSSQTGKVTRTHIKAIGGGEIDTPTFTGNLNGVKQRPSRDIYSKFEEIIKLRGISASLRKFLIEGLKSGELKSSQIEELINSLKTGKVKWSDIQQLAEGFQTGKITSPHIKKIRRTGHGIDVATLIGKVMEELKQQPSTDLYPRMKRTWKLEGIPSVWMESLIEGLKAGKFTSSQIQDLINGVKVSTSTISLSDIPRLAEANQTDEITSIQIKGNGGGEIDTPKLIGDFMKGLKQRPPRDVYSRLNEILKSGGISSTSRNFLTEGLKTGKLSSPQIEDLINGLKSGKIKWSDIQRLANGFQTGKITWTDVKGIGGEEIDMAGLLDDLLTERKKIPSRDIYSQLRKILKLGGMSSVRRKFLIEGFTAGILTPPQIKDLIDGLKSGKIKWSDVNRLADGLKMGEITPIQVKRTGDGGGRLDVATLIGELLEGVKRGPSRKIYSTLKENLESGGLSLPLIKILIQGLKSGGSTPFQIKAVMEGLKTGYITLTDLERLALAMKVGNITSIQIESPPSICCVASEMTSSQIEVLLKGLASGGMAQSQIQQLIRGFKAEKIKPSDIERLGGGKVKATALIDNMKGMEVTSRMAGPSSHENQEDDSSSDRKDSLEESRSATNSERGGDVSGEWRRNVITVTDDGTKRTESRYNSGEMFDREDGKISMGILHTAGENCVAISEFQIMNQNIAKLVASFRGLLDAQKQFQVEIEDFYETSRKIDIKVENIIDTFNSQSTKIDSLTDSIQAISSKLDEVFTIVSAIPSKTSTGVQSSGEQDEGGTNTMLLTRLKTTLETLSILCSKSFRKQNELIVGLKENVQVIVDNHSEEKSTSISSSTIENIKASINTQVSIQIDTITTKIQNIQSQIEILVTSFGTPINETLKRIYSVQEMVVTIIKMTKLVMKRLRVSVEVEIPRERIREPVLWFLKGHDERN